ncbi:MAG: response regulator transcription factor [Oricola sp.]|nr:response regulator transcription factor [Oricola sp.]
MLGNVSPSAFAAAAAECTDNDSVNSALARLIKAVGASYAFIYRFNDGLANVGGNWTPVYEDFPAEITRYYRDSNFSTSDSLTRAAFGSYLPVTLTETAAGMEMSPKRIGLHALFSRHGIKDLLAMHVSDRPGRTVYIALAYDRQLDGLSAFERRRLHAAFEMFMRRAWPLQVRNQTRELSPKEQDVMRLVAAGDSNKEIARSLGVSLSTVNTLVTRSFDKLGVHSRTEAVIAAARSGLALVA